MPLKALNLVYCQFDIAQRIIIEDIGNKIKETLKVFSSVPSKHQIYTTTYQMWLL